VSTTPVPSVNLSDPPKSVETGNKRRHVATLSNVPVLGRTALVSRIQKVASKASPTNRFPNLTAFLQPWKWIGPYVRDLIHRNAPYQGYSRPEDGVFPLASQDSPLTLALAADWGTGTLEAETVAANMKRCAPHCTVHLGDVYYMGEKDEISENCLAVKTGHFTGVRWPWGSLGSFALMGNHEMYSGGHAFFQTFLPHMGLLAPNQTVRVPQNASYFCLETDHWLVLGLDTGYHSGGLVLLGSIPGINRIPFLNVDARLDDKLLDWLKQVMKAYKDKGVRKSILLLTHHQPVSAFEHSYVRPAEQLIKTGFFAGQEIVWLFGHEHRLAIYNRQTIAGSLTAYPRCIGHGGMPVSKSKLLKPDPRVLFYDPREHPIDNKDPNTTVGYNGHLVLLFQGEDLSIEYRDILHNQLLLTETFHPAGNGTLQHTFTKPSESPLTGG
jgi:hypothetical protein